LEEKEKMKKMVELTLLDIFFMKLSVFLSSCWLIGLLASFWPFQILIFLIQNKWYLLVGAVVFAVVPVRKFFYPAKKPKKRSKKK